MHRVDHGNMGFCGHLFGGILNLEGRCEAAGGGLAEANIFLLGIASGKGGQHHQPKKAQQNTGQYQSGYAGRAGLRQLISAKAALKSAGEEGRSARRTVHDGPLDQTAAGPRLRSGVVHTLLLWTFAVRMLSLRTLFTRYALRLT